MGYMKTTSWEVVDGMTGAVVAVCASMRRAINKADRLDNEYGSHRWFARPVAG